MSYKERSYRNWVQSDELVSFEVREKETDLFISAKRRLESQAREAIVAYRSDLERYIRRDEEFFASLAPVDVKEDAPSIVKVMADAAAAAGVGPMAAVAGAIAEFVGRDLLAFTDEVIVENGGDIFLRTIKKRRLGVYAGEDSPFTGNLALEIAPKEEGLGISTSSGTVSHSLSFGKADAALIISKEAALADAVATATCNVVKNEFDINAGIEFAKSIEGVLGVLIIVKDKMGSWGEISIT